MLEQGGGARVVGSTGLPPSRGKGGFSPRGTSHREGQKDLRDG